MSKEVVKFILFVLAALATAIKGYPGNSGTDDEEAPDPKRRGRPAKAKPTDEDEEDEDEDEEDDDTPKKVKGTNSSMFEEEPKRRGRPTKAKPTDEDEEDEDEDEEDDEITDKVLQDKAKKYMADGGTKAELKKLVVKYIKKGDDPLVANVSENKRPAFVAELVKMTKAL